MPKQQLTTDLNEKGIILHVEHLKKRQKDGAKTPVPEKVEGQDEEIGDVFDKDAVITKDLDTGLK